MSQPLPRDPAGSLQGTIPARFSAAAHGYDAGAKVQKDVVALLEPLLDGVPPPRRILEVGCGSGQLTRRLCRRFPDTPIDAVDISARMVEVARSELSGRVAFHTGDAGRFTGPQPYDLIVSSSALHWMTPLSGAVQHLARQLAPQGALVCAIMLAGTLGELRASRLRAAPHKPPRGRLPSEADVVSALRDARLEPTRVSTDTHTEAYESASAFLAHIHDQGLTGGAVSRSDLPLNRSDLDRLVRDYQSHYGNGDGRVYASYRTLALKATRGTEPGR